MPVRIGPEVQALPRRLSERAAPLGWGLAAAAAVIGLAVLGRGGVAEPPPAPPGPVAAGEWVDLPPAPVMTPGEHHGVWTGEELVVVGGGNEFVAYDPDAGRWRELAAPPIDFGHDPVLTWTGHEVLVWGGGVLDGRQAELAAYNPLREAWRQGASLDRRLRPLVAHVWTGDRLLVWDRTRGASYDPATDAWTDISRIPVGWESAAAVAAGEEVIVRGNRLGVPFASGYDPVSDTWRQVRRPWMSDPALAAAVWTGREVLMWGRPRLIDGEDGPPAGFAFHPDSGTWSWLPEAPVDTRPEELYGFGAVWTGSEAVIYGGLPTRVGLLYDGAWRELPPGGGARLDAVLAWTGEELLVWGGYTTRGPTTDLVAWRPS